MSKGGTATSVCHACLKRLQLRLSPITMADSNTEIGDSMKTKYISAGDSSHNAPPADVVELCRETFKTTSEYFKGELEGTIEHYKLLETMNRVTVSKYSEMKNTAMAVGTALQELNDKYKSLQLYLDQIDQIDGSVTSLEQAAHALDAYSKRLEAKFKALEKR